MRPVIRDRGFFGRPAVEVAQALLGCVLVREIDGHCLRGRIVETEAYIGPDDTASHAHRGRTPRNQVMFGPPGYGYIYLVYGLHSMFNVVTDSPEFPAAVLVRAIEPQAGLELMRRRRGRPDRELTNGPGKLCQALAIDTSLNGIDLTEGRGLWLEAGPSPAAADVASGPRIGIGYAADEDQRAPRRFWLRGNPFVSR